jgi:hypothetical protein
VSTMHSVVRASQSSGSDDGVNRRHGRAVRYSGRVSRVNPQPGSGKVAGLGQVRSDSTSGLARLSRVSWVKPYPLTRAGLDGLGR